MRTRIAAKRAIFGALQRGARHLWRERFGAVVDGRADSSRRGEGEWNAEFGD